MAYDVAESDSQLREYTGQRLDSLGDGLPICRMVKLEMVITSKLNIEMFGRCQLGQVGVEADLVASDRVHRMTDCSKEGVDPPPASQSRPTPLHRP